MLKETLSKIEDSIRKIDSKEKDKLLHLVGRLKQEIGEISKTHSEQAQSIVGFAEVAAHEATRQKKSPKQLELSLEGLSTSVQDFEASHPGLTSTVNDLCNLLARIGI